ALVVDLDGLNSAVLEDDVQLQQILANGVGGQDQHVVGGHSLRISLEQDHAGQVGGLVGAVGGLLQHGVDLDIDALVHVAHLVPAGGNAVLHVLAVALGIVVVEGHGVLVHGVGLGAGTAGLGALHHDAAVAVVIA